MSRPPVMELTVKFEGNFGEGANEARAWVEKVIPEAALVRLESMQRACPALTDPCFDYTFEVLLEGQRNLV